MPVRLLKTSSSNASPPMVTTKLAQYACFDMSPMASPLPLLSMTSASNSKILPAPKTSSGASSYITNSLSKWKPQSTSALPSPSTMLPEKFVSLPPASSPRPSSNSLLIPPLSLARPLSTYRPALALLRNLPNLPIFLRFSRLMSIIVYNNLEAYYYITVWLSTLLAYLLSPQSNLPSLTLLNSLNKPLIASSLTSVTIPIIY